MNPSIFALLQSTTCLLQPTTCRDGKTHCPPQRIYYITISAFGGTRRLITRLMFLPRFSNISAKSHHEFVKRPMEAIVAALDFHRHGLAVPPYQEVNLHPPIPVSVARPCVVEQLAARCLECLRYNIFGQHSLVYAQSVVEDGLDSWFGRESNISRIFAISLDVTMSFRHLLRHS